MRAWLAGGMLACSALSAACAAILGFDPLTEGTEQPDAQEPPADAGDLDAGVADAGPRSNCVENLVRPPTSSGSRTPHHFAFNSLRFLPSADGGVSPGLDLDCVNTADPDRIVSCKNTTVATEAIDFPDGVDNAAARVFELVSRSLDFDSFDRRVKSGDVGMIFTILGDFVAGGSGMTVDAYPTRGMEVAGFEGCERRDAGNVPTSGDAGRPPLKTDRWCVDKRFKELVSDRSTMITNDAWLDGDRFVARFTHLSIPMLGRGADGLDETDDQVAYINLQNVWIVARLDRTDTNQWWLRDGIIGGRWKMDDIFAMYADAIDPQCGLDAGPLNSLGAALCGYQDITVASGSNASTPCDAISIGIGFDSYELDDDGDFAEVNAAEDLCFADAIAVAAEAGVPLYTCPTGAE